MTQSIVMRNNSIPIPVIRDFVHAAAWIVATTCGFYISREVGISLAAGALSTTLLYPTTDKFYSNGSRQDAKDKYRRECRELCKPTGEYKGYRPDELFTMAYRNWRGRRARFRTYFGGVVALTTWLFVHSIYGLAVHRDQIHGALERSVTANEQRAAVIERGRFKLSGGCYNVCAPR
jgi:hypothetical protein